MNKHIILRKFCEYFIFESLAKCLMIIFKYINFFVFIDNILYRIWNVLFTPMYVMNVATNFMNEYFNKKILFLATYYANYNFSMS